jgi:hypothetical protein
MRLKQSCANKPILRKTPLLNYLLCKSFEANKKKDYKHTNKTKLY